MKRRGFFGAMFGAIAAPAVAVAAKNLPDELTDKPKGELLDTESIHPEEGYYSREMASQGGYVYTQLSCTAPSRAWVEQQTRNRKVFVR